MELEKIIKISSKYGVDVDTILDEDKTFEEYLHRKNNNITVFIDSEYVKAELIFRTDLTVFLKKDNKINEVSLQYAIDLIHIVTPYITIVTDKIYKKTDALKYLSKYLSRQVDTCLWAGVEER